MKRSSSSGLDSNIIIAGVVITLIVLVLIFVFMRKTNNESFANTPEDKKGYNFRTKRAANGMATCLLRLSGTPKDIAEKTEFSEKLCPVKNGVKGSYICEERSYNKTEPTKVSCGCMYDVSDTDPNNLFNEKK